MNRMDEINDRLNNRDQFNNGVIKFDLRSMPTRYTFKYPILNTKEDCNTSLKNVTQDYNKEIEIESMLRNQLHALQHGASQSVYIPSSSSDLYITRIPISKNNPKQPYEGLFESTQYKTTENNYINSAVTNNSFNNCTRSICNFK